MANGTLSTLPWQQTWPSSMANGTLSTLPWQQTWPSSMANGTPPILPWQQTWLSSVANGTPPTLPWQQTWPSSVANGTPPTLPWQQTWQTWPSSMANRTLKKNLTGHKPCTVQRASHKTVLKFFLEQWHKMSFGHCSTHSCDTVLFKEILSNGASWPGNIFKKWATTFMCKFCVTVLSISMWKVHILSFLLEIWAPESRAMLDHFLPQKSRMMLRTLCHPWWPCLWCHRHRLPNTKTWCFCHRCRTTDTDSWLRNEVSGHHLAPLSSSSSSSSSHWSWVMLRSHRHYQHYHHHHHTGVELGS